jgi:hypothetical protein
VWFSSFFLKLPCAVLDRQVGHTFHSRAQDLSEVGAVQMSKATKKHRLILPSLCPPGAKLRAASGWGRHARGAFLYPNPSASSGTQVTWTSRGHTFLWGDPWSTWTPGAGVEASVLPKVSPGPLWFRKSWTFTCWDQGNVAVWLLVVREWRPAACRLQAPHGSVETAGWGVCWGPQPPLPRARPTLLHSAPIGWGESILLCFVVVVWGYFCWMVVSGL